MKGKMQAKITEYTNMKQGVEGEVSFEGAEISFIPEDWKVTRVGDVCDIEDGKRAKGGAIDEGIPSIGGEHVDTEGNIKWDAMKYIPEAFYESLRQGKIKLKDVLMVKDGATTSKTAFVRDLPVENAAVNEHVFIFRSSRKDYLMNEFLFYVLFSEIGQRQVRRSFHGACQGGINRQNVNDFLIPLPSLLEQQDKIIEAAKNLKKSFMQKLFTEGLRGEEQKETEIGLIPKSWKVVKLGDVSDFKNGVNFTKDQKGNTGILTIDVLNMYGEGLCVNLENLYRVNKEINDDYLLKDGDILFVRSSLKREGVGWTSLYKKANEPVTFCGFIIRARLKSDGISPEFLTNFLRTSIAREKLIAGSGKVAITNINQGMLGQVAIPIPPLLEQQRIVHILSTVDRKIEVEKGKKSTLNELFKTMLHESMIGEIRIKDIEV